MRGFMACVGFTVVLFVPASAFAQTCPSPFTGDPCTSNCALAVNGFSVTCDFSGESAAIEAHAFNDNAGFGYANISVFGIDDGGDFCCWYDDPDADISEITLIGSDFDDFMEFNYGADDLDFVPGTLPNGLQSGFITGNILGGDGDDLIDGSDDPDSCRSFGIQCCGGDDECDNLYGENDSDVIFGFDGWDLIEGNNGPDTLNGNEGNDEMLGGNGDDTMDGGDNPDLLKGNDGADDLTGGANADILDGGANSDTMRGGGGDDVLCGGTGTGDHFDGGAGSNDLWAPTAAVSPVGVSTSSDRCGHSSQGNSWAGANCQYGFSTAPAACN